ncbi:MAG: arginine repressor [Deltaproteobacteria bacterium]|nr:arginine repressor [Deltaproteobacteria bacterium]
MSKQQTIHEASERQQLLLRLVGGGKLRTQQDLQRAFAKRGVKVTQSSLSRDIKRLGLVKVRGAYALPGGGDGRPLPPLLDIDAAGPNLLVIKTLPGMAASVAVAIDERRMPHIVGTVAGDDTVFVATALGAKQDRIVQSLRNFFPRQA